MRVTISIPDPIGEAVRAFARDEGESVSSVYANAVDEYLRSRRRQAALERIEAHVGKAYVAPDALAELERDQRTSDRRRRVYDAYAEAAEDPVFMADMKGTKAAFESTVGDGFCAGEG